MFCGLVQEKVHESTKSWFIPPPAAIKERNAQSRSSPAHQHQYKVGMPHVKFHVNENVCINKALRFSFCEHQPALYNVLCWIQNYLESHSKLHTHSGIQSQKGMLRSAYAYVAGKASLLVHKKRVSSTNASVSVTTKPHYSSAQNLIKSLINTQTCY